MNKSTNEFGLFSTVILFALIKDCAKKHFGAGACNFFGYHKSRDSFFSDYIYTDNEYLV